MAIVTILCALACLFCVAFFLHVWLFVFTHEGAEKQPSMGYKQFVMNMCGGDKFVFSLFSFGYLKLAWKRFLRYYCDKIWTKPKAKLGKACPKLTVVTLDGKHKCLLQDYIAKSDKPVILNFGSYT